MKILIIFLLVVTASCSGNGGQKPPAGILSEAEIAVILAEMHVAEAYSRLNPKSPDSTKALLEMMSSHVLKTAGVSKAVYDSSYNWYSGQPEIMDRIYDEVLTEMSRNSAQMIKK